MSTTIFDLSKDIMSTKILPFLTSKDAISSGESGVSNISEEVVLEYLRQNQSMFLSSNINFES